MRTRNADYCKTYREKHPDRVRDVQRNYYKNNPEKIKAKAKRYRTKHRVDIKIKRAAYKLRKRGASKDKLWLWDEKRERVVELIWGEVDGPEIIRYVYSREIGMYEVSNRHSRILGVLCEKGFTAI
jgi:hypothetical protein